MKKGTTKPRMSAAERREWDELLAEYVGQDRKILSGMLDKLTKREREFLARTIRHLLSNGEQVVLLTNELGKYRGVKNLNADAEIQRMAREGMSGGEIARSLKDRGILTEKGKTWTAPNVRRHCSDIGLKLKGTHGRPSNENST